jgi:hypothetical protein
MATIKIHNATSDEIIEREMTTDELVQWETDKVAIETEAQALAEAEVKRQALLDRLGITADEARLLLG